ncbi:radical SAM protein [Paenibacillus donghaensis]|uniref:Radical SAM protein n=1 Tax=Paenibacillus donghaensis TaxID=414771 RepID=A0A2Z2K7T3_9BACL|nr:radical SAM protein [Paenibacillus donghaensis]ASA21177.1 radical SAM protein [Paenibacillus donghaensis]
MTPKLDLAQYLNNGVERIIRDALKATLKAPRESVFLVRYAVAAAKAKKRRAELAAQNEHIPPFLIASITSRCNLWCAGCYAHHEHACADAPARGELHETEWERIFTEASELGVSFILLAGGEPLIRRDVLEQASAHRDILFPVFTNATMLDGTYLSLFDSARNLVPVLSIEGDRSMTDARRGSGVYQRLTEVMEALQSKSILYGVSVTVTVENLAYVTGDQFLTQLQQSGCRVVIYVEYVPVDPGTQDLAPTHAERAYLAQRLTALRSGDAGMVMISFPGDELASGGCLAAGRGFFHINAHGGVEPCPFSPYSDTSLREGTLRDALHSPLFAKLSSGELLQHHTGGCVLFEQQEMVRRLL